MISASFILTVFIYLKKTTWDSVIYFKFKFLFPFVALFSPTEVIEVDDSDVEEDLFLTTSRADQR